MLYLLLLIWQIYTLNLKLLQNLKDFHKFLTMVVAAIWMILFVNSTVYYYCYFYVIFIVFISHVEILPKCLVKKLLLLFRVICFVKVRRVLSFDIRSGVLRIRPIYIRCLCTHSLHFRCNASLECHSLSLRCVATWGRMMLLHLRSHAAFRPFRRWAFLLILRNLVIVNLWWPDISASDKLIDGNNFLCK